MKVVRGLRTRIDVYNRRKIALMICIYVSLVSIYLLRCAYMPTVVSQTYYEMTLNPALVPKDEAIVGKLRSLIDSLKITFRFRHFVLPELFVSSVDSLLGRSHYVTSLAYSHALLSLLSFIFLTRQFPWANMPYSPPSLAKLRQSKAAPADHPDAAAAVPPADPMIVLPEKAYASEDEPLPGDANASASVNPSRAFQSPSLFLCLCHSCARVCSRVALFSFYLLCVFFGLVWFGYHFGRFSEEFRNTEFQVSFVEGVYSSPDNVSLAWNETTLHLVAHRLLFRDGLAWEGIANNNGDASSIFYVIDQQHPLPVLSSDTKEPLSESSPSLVDSPLILSSTHHLQQSLFLLSSFSSLKNDKNSNISLSAVKDSDHSHNTDTFTFVCPGLSIWMDALQYHVNGFINQKTAIPMACHVYTYHLYRTYVLPSLFALGSWVLLIMCFVYFFLSMPNDEKWMFEQRQQALTEFRKKYPITEPSRNLFIDVESSVQ